MLGYCLLFYEDQQRSLMEVLKRLPLWELVNHIKILLPLFSPSLKITKEHRVQTGPQKKHCFSCFCDPSEHLLTVFGAVTQAVSNHINDDTLPESLTSSHIHITAKKNGKKWLLNRSFNHINNHCLLLKGHNNIWILPTQLSILVVTIVAKCCISLP